MNITFEPFVGVGPFKFGMSKSDVRKANQIIPGIDEFEYENDKLCMFSCYPSDIKEMYFADKDVLKMNWLSAALYFADQSNEYGQAQGGSLYFIDLGCAILQFETAIREFVFFSREYDPREPLRNMSPSLIKEYYEEQDGDEQYFSQ